MVVIPYGAKVSVRLDLVGGGGGEDKGEAFQKARRGGDKRSLRNKKDIFELGRTYHNKVRKREGEGTTRKKAGAI